jgi:mTERF domain-containing protein
MATRLLSPSSASCGSSIHRLLSAEARLNPPNPSFAVEEYLVATCGLTRAQALKASAKLSHLKCPTNPDAVLAFLGGLGLSSGDLAALAAKDPLFLCASVERTLAPVLVRLTGHGLSHTEITWFVSVRPSIFRSRSAVFGLPYFLSILGSVENLVQ